MLIRRARVLREQAHHGGQVLLGNVLFEFLRKIHRQAMAFGLLGEPADRVRHAVHIRQVRLDVHNWRAVHQIRAGDDERDAPVLLLHANQADNRQTDAVRAERRARREHTQSGIAAQPRRTHSRPPIILLRAVELPEQPQVGVILNAAERLADAVLFHHHDAGNHLRHKPRLPRHAEFLPKAVFDSCNDFHPDSSPFPYGISIAHPRPPVKGRKQKGISVSFAFGKRIFLG